MNRKRTTQLVLTVLAIPVFMAATAGMVGASTIGASESKVLLAQTPETPTQPEQPAEPAQPEQPAAESPEEPAEPAEPAAPAEPASSTNWLVIGGGILAALVVIALIASLLRRPRDAE